MITGLGSIVVGGPWVAAIVGGLESAVTVEAGFVRTAGRKRSIFSD